MIDILTQIYFKIENKIQCYQTKGEVCLFVCFESHEQFFSYLATVTITGDGVMLSAYGF
jgi:hypothetical protein